MGARAVLLGLVAIHAIATHTPAAAQYVSPMVYDVAPSGKGATRQVEFWNSQNRTTAIEVTVARRTYGEDGVAHDIPEPSAFQIIPAQFIAGAGDRVKVRLRYTGPAPLPASATYAISFRQVPIPNAAEEGKLRVLLDFTSLANVVPPDASSDIQVASASVAGDAAVVTFVNRGNRYGRLDFAPLRLQDAANAVEFQPAELRDTYDLRWLLPGQRRTTTLPLAGAQFAGPVRAEFRRESDR